MIRRPASRWPALFGLLFLGLLAGLALAAFFSLPRVVAFQPAAGTRHVSPRAPVRLTFSRPMDAASVEAALRFSPDLPGQLTWEGNTLSFQPGQPWPAGQSVTVTLSGGRSRAGLPLLGTQAWAFQAGGERLAYLSGQVANLWALSPGGETSPEQITFEPFGLYDYDISPDGARFVYAALRADGGADLRLVDVDSPASGAGGAPVDLLLCPGEACLSPAFSPDGRRVAYERHALAPGAAGEVTLEAGRVHWVDIATGEDAAVGEAGQAARFPQWTPDGRLSYFDAVRQALVVYQPDSGLVTYVPNSSGDVGTWSPDGQFVVFAEIFLPPEPTPDPARPAAEHREQFYSQLLRVTVATNQVQDLSGAQAVEDASPVYSPSGLWLAFARRGLGPGQWTPGRQLWLMRADGSEARPLTTEPVYNHSAFRWSPDEKALAYMRFNPADPSQPAEIWWIGVDGAGARRLVTGGYLPHWLP